MRLLKMLSLDLIRLSVPFRVFEALLCRSRSKVEVSSGSRGNPPRPVMTYPADRSLRRNHQLKCAHGFVLVLCMIRRPRYTSHQNPSLDEPKTTSTSLHPQPQNTESSLPHRHRQLSTLLQPRPPKPSNAQRIPYKTSHPGVNNQSAGRGCIQCAKQAARLITHPIPNATPILSTRLLESDFAVDVVTEPL